APHTRAWSQINLEYPVPTKRHSSSLHTRAQCVRQVHTLTQRYHEAAGGCCIDLQAEGSSTKILKLANILMSPAPMARELQRLLEMCLVLDPIRACQLEEISSTAGLNSPIPPQPNSPIHNLTISKPSIPNSPIPNLTISKPSIANSPIPNPPIPNLTISKPSIPTPPSPTSTSQIPLSQPTYIYVSTICMVTLVEFYQTASLFTVWIAVMMSAVMPRELQRTWRDGHPVSFLARYARVKRKESTPKRSLHGARQPWGSAALQPPV
ncbi:unnamed protein product, partial [Pleuronectes platessa]